MTQLLKSGTNHSQTVENPHKVYEVEQSFTLFTGSESRLCRSNQHILYIIAVHKTIKEEFLYTFLLNMLTNCFPNSR